MHPCWGNYEGPHTYDISVDKILPFLSSRNRPPSSLKRQTRVMHEWSIWRTPGSG